MFQVRFHNSLVLPRKLWSNREAIRVTMWTKMACTAHQASIARGPQIPIVSCSTCLQNYWTNVPVPTNVRENPGPLRNHATTDVPCHPALASWLEATSQYHSWRKAPIQAKSNVFQLKQHHKATSPCPSTVALPEPMWDAQAENWIQLFLSAGRVQTWEILHAFINGVKSACWSLALLARF